MNAYDQDLRAIAVAASQVANYCDHSDHNEAVNADWVLGAGQTLRSVAQRIAARERLDLLGLYAKRLKTIETRNVASATFSYDGAAAVREATTWRELQLVQLEHDRHYHPDVIGLHKSEQLQHYALHLAKLVGALAAEPSEPEQHDSFVATRLPDMLLFGMKLATVMGTKLPDTELQLVPAASSLAVA